MKQLFILASVPLCLIAPLSLTLYASSATAQMPGVASGVTSLEPSVGQTGGQSVERIPSPSADQSMARFKAGDRIRLMVAGFPDLSGEQIISTEGTVQLPLAGSISIGGLTLAQATEQISQALLPYVRRPQVGIAIVSLSPIRLSITGEVVQPGPRTLAAAETENSTSIPLSRALTLAGGITPNADLRNVIIRRSHANADRPVLLANRRSADEITVNLWEAIESGSLASDIRVYNDDEIVVPKAQSANVNQQALLSSTLAPDQVTVSVAGEVRNPGQVEISPTAGVSDAVAAAGGLTENGRQEGLLLLRMQPDGRMESRSFAFGSASEPLRNGDLIVVQQSSRGRTNNFFELLGNILTPISPLLRIFTGGL